MAGQGLMVAGTVIQTLGNLAGNSEQAAAERRTAQFFYKQAQFARHAMARELHIAERNYAYRLGSQISAIAKGGADVGSGSAVNTLAATVAAKLDELVAIRRKGELDIELARLRGEGSEKTSNTLSSLSYNILQGATTIVGNMAKGVDSGGGSQSVLSSGGSPLPAYRSQYLGTIGGE